MAGSSVTAAMNTTPIEMANAGPIVDSNPKRAKNMPRKVTATVAADAVMTLPTDVTARTHSLIRVRAAPQEVVVAADEEHGANPFPRRPSSRS